MKTVIFILGSAHSGTTLIDMVLGSHSSAFSLGEFAKIGGRLKAGKPMYCQICDRECPQWSRYMKNINRKFVHQAVFNSFSVPFIVDSSKSLSWFRSQSKILRKQEDYDFRVIRILRDGLSTMLKTKRKVGAITRDSIKGWANYNSNADECLAKVPKDKKYTFKYEELCTDLTGTLKKICAFLHWDFEESMLRFWEHEHHIVAGNAKPVSLVRLFHDKISIEDLHSDVKDFFKRYGYSIQIDTRPKEKMSKQDIALFLKHGRKKNAQYGYSNDW